MRYQATPQEVVFVGATTSAIHDSYKVPGMSYCVAMLVGSQLCKVRGFGFRLWTLSTTGIRVAEGGKCYFYPVCNKVRTRCPKSTSQPILSRMYFTLHCRTPHGASRLVQATFAWSVKARRASGVAGIRGFKVRRLRVTHHNYCTGWFRLNAQNCVPD